MVVWTPCVFLLHMHGCPHTHAWVPEFSPTLSFPWILLYFVFSFPLLLWIYHCSPSSHSSLLPSRSYGQREGNLCQCQYSLVCETRSRGLKFTIQQIPSLPALRSTGSMGPPSLGSLLWPGTVQRYLLHWCVQSSFQIPSPKCSSSLPLETSFSSFVLCVGAWKPITLCWKCLFSHCLFAARGGQSLQPIYPKKSGLKKREVGAFHARFLSQKQESRE